MRIDFSNIMAGIAFLVFFIFTVIGYFKPEDTSNTQLLLLLGMAIYLKADSIRSIVRGER